VWRLDRPGTKGFEGELLNRVVETITARRDIWLATMMDEELHPSAVGTSGHLAQRVCDHRCNAHRSYDSAGALPGARTASPWACLVNRAPCGGSFSVGAYSAKRLMVDWRKSGLQMVVIGLDAPGFGFPVGHLFQTGGG